VTMVRLRLSERVVSLIAGQSADVAFDLGHAAGHEG
jgi:hypothetical protein